MLSGADTQTRTGDLILTKDALYHLSYISIKESFWTKSPLFEQAFKFLRLYCWRNKLKPGNVLLSHGETPHYHRR